MLLLLTEAIGIKRLAIDFIRDAEFRNRGCSDGSKVTIGVAIELGSSSANGREVHGYLAIAA